MRLYYKTISWKRQRAGVQPEDKGDNHLHIIHIRTVSVFQTNVFADFVIVQDVFFEDALMLPCTAPVVVPNSSTNSASLIHMSATAPFLSLGIFNLPYSSIVMMFLSSFIAFHFRGLDYMAWQMKFSIRSIRCESFSMSRLTFSAVICRLGR